MQRGRSTLMRGLGSFFLLLAFSLSGTLGHASDEEILVVTTPFPPYVVPSNDGTPNGPAVKVVQRVCEDAGIDCTIRALPWARAYKMAMNDGDTLIFSISRRPDREDRFQWVGEVSPYTVRLFALEGTPAPQDASWRDLKTLSVAGQLKDVKAEFLSRNGFTVSFVPSAETTINMLYGGRADLVAGDALSLPYRVEELGLDLDRLRVVAEIPELSSNLYLAASQTTDKTVVQRLRDCLGKLKRNGTFSAIWEAAGLPPGPVTN